ncbi:MAG TPA: PQQ-binding-like beta-propeller repeat protein, partial [Bacteroidota bacterium]|nr:PQQ-binding-like beta-propeller repeat protein [Bacteroidota bacterium]
MRALITIGLCLVAAGCGGLRMQRSLTPHQAEDWPTFARNNERSARAPDVLTPPLKLAWDADVSAGVGNGSPLIVDSIVFLGTLRGELYAVNSFTGKQIGSISLGDAIQGSPVINGNLAFVALANSRESLVAFDFVEGKVRWKKSYGDLEVTPLLLGRRLYFGNTAGVFFCAEGVTGDQKWRYEIPDNTTRKGIRSSAAACDSLSVVFGAEDGHLYCLDPATGALRWKHDTGAPVTASPLIIHGLVCAGNLGGRFVALDLSSGNLRWHAELGAYVYANAVPADGLVIVGDASGQLTAMHAEDGTRAWTSNLG